FRRSKGFLHLNDLLPKRPVPDFEPHLSLFSPRPSLVFPTLQMVLEYRMTAKSTESTARSTLAIPDSCHETKLPQEASQAAAVGELEEKEDINSADVAAEAAAAAAAAAEDHAKRPESAASTVDPNAHDDAIPNSYLAEQYEALKTLNSGGEGTCTLVRQKKTEELFALKVVLNPHLIDKKPREVAVLDTVSVNRRPHDNIIHMEAWAYNTTLYTPYAEYYLPYYPLGDLLSLITEYQERSIRIPEAFIWKAYLQLASALEYLHRGFYTTQTADQRRSQHQHQHQHQHRLPPIPGLVHRDIKPENILLRAPAGSSFTTTATVAQQQEHPFFATGATTTTTTFPDLILADFGHATTEEFTYTPCGTDIWRAPELPRSSPKSDVWAMGAVIHTMVHFYPPIAPLPAHIPPTSHNRAMWERKPEARQPLLATVSAHGYSDELGEVLG
ncbi:MAG: hypothetical protein Q9163_006366, partial [Psora crenata]